MSVGRRGPLSFLDTEWRTALWKRWVSAHLVPGANGPVPQAHTPPPTLVAEEAPAQQNVALDETPPVNVANGAPTASAPVDPPKRAPLAHDEIRRSERRADVRARFDALSERLQGLEDAIDVIARRLSHRTRRERRSDRRTAELVESISEMVEAQASAIDGLGSAIERIERRLDRHERPTAREDGERRDSRTPKARNSEPPRSAHPPRADEASEFSLNREAAEDPEAAISGASIRGSIGDMSLSTVLAMIEIERRSGRLKVQGEDGSIIAFELEEGSVVGSRVSENDVDAVESLREVLTWKNGRFWFRQNPSESLVSPPRSVNSLLLEATRQIDEAVRVG
jgi:Domain of unknown function (DUF4388)